MAVHEHVHKNRQAKGETI